MGKTLEFVIDNDFWNWNLSESPIQFMIHSVSMYDFKDSVIVSSSFANNIPSLFLSVPWNSLHILYFYRL